jgi:hypothetical protein
MLWLPLPAGRLPAGKRDRDECNKFSLPPGLCLKNIQKLTGGGGHTQHEESEEGSAFGRHFSNLFDRCPGALDCFALQGPEVPQEQSRRDSLARVVADRCAALLLFLQPAGSGAPQGLKPLRGSAAVQEPHLGLHSLAQVQDSPACGGEGGRCMQCLVLFGGQPDVLYCLWYEVSSQA